MFWVRKRRGGSSPERNLQHPSIEAQSPIPGGGNTLRTSSLRDIARRLTTDCPPLECPSRKVFVEASLFSVVLQNRLSEEALTFNFHSSQLTNEKQRHLSLKDTKKDV